MQQYINVVQFTKQQSKLQHDDRYTLNPSMFVFTQADVKSQRVYVYAPVDTSLKQYITNIRKDLKALNFLSTLKGDKKITITTTTKLKGKVVNLVSAN